MSDEAKMVSDDEAREALDYATTASAYALLDDYIAQQAALRAQLAEAEREANRVNLLHRARYETLETQLAEVTVARDRAMEALDEVKAQFSADPANEKNWKAVACAMEAAAHVGREDAALRDLSAKLGATPAPGEPRRCGRPPDNDLCRTCGDYRNFDGCGRLF